MQEYFTTSQAAKICGVSVASIIRWIRDGRLKCVKTLGGHRRITREDLQSFIESIGIAGLPSDSGKLNAPKILIVEDDPAESKLMVQAIRLDFPDVQIESVTNGFDAGWQLKELRPDIVLLDLNIPGINGYEVCKRIETDRNLTHTHVIIVTGESRDSKKLVDLKYDDFLGKPFSISDLSGKVAAFLPITSKQGGLSA